MAGSDKNGKSETFSTPADAVAPVIDFLRRHAPFDQMAALHLDFLAAHVRPVGYAQGKVITGPDRGPAQTLFLIKHGRVRGEIDGESTSPEVGVWELATGECFPLGALLARRPARLRHRAVTDTVCLELGRNDFDQLVMQSPVFHDFCSRRLASLLDYALRSVQQRVATEALGGSTLSTPLASLIRRAPVTCTPSTPLRQALKRMEAEHVGSMIVAEEGCPSGVLTLHDVLSRVVNQNASMEAPIERVMTPAPFTLPSTASASQGAALMIQEGIGHLCVTEGGRLIGVVSERDLFSLQRIGLVNLSRSITHAPDIATLARLEKDVHRLIDQMWVHGASVEQLTQIITLLNDHVARRVILLCLDEIGPPSVPFTWVAFGSEGRQEQMLKTDQDNGIVFLVPPGRAAGAVRAELLPIANRINHALADIGFPLCAGHVMANHPACCLSLSEWQNRFAVWIDQGTPTHLLNVSIYFDLRPLYGDEKPVAALREFVLQRVPPNRRFLHQMAVNALRNRPPLGLMRGFVVASRGEHPHTLDLKLNGSVPFVDGARLLALANGIAATSTFDRLRAAARAGHVSDSESDAWIDAYAFIQFLRMRNFQTQARRGEPLSNHLDPDSLNELDQRILKEAFRQSRKLQRRLALDYQLS